LYCLIYYFTSLAHWDPLKQERHKRYLRVLKDKGVNVVIGTLSANTFLGSKSGSTPATFARIKFQAYPHEKTRQTPGKRATGPLRA
jgi:hypothetical protein